MKKILIILIIVLIFILCGVTIVKGIQIGRLTIFGIEELKTHDNLLNETIQKATKQISTDYQQKVKELETSLKQLKDIKATYEDKKNDSIGENGELLTTTGKPYKIEFLWVRIGNHAKSEGVEIKMERTASTSGASNRYDLHFTAVGTYIGVADFISDIEDDSSLGFKIEDFRMTAVSTDTVEQVQGTFTCKDIPIEGISDSPISSDVNVNINNSNTNNNINTKDNTTVNNTSNNTANNNV